MKFSITYFYNVRYLKQNQIPYSTAKFPPKWFGRNEKGEVYLDKNNVVIGLTAKMFVPHLQEECPCECKDNSACSFLKKYREQLNKLDFEDVVNKLETATQLLATSLNIENPEIVLLVFEKPDNPCSERVVLKEWFKAHNIVLNELEIVK